MKNYILLKLETGEKRPINTAGLNIRQWINVNFGGWGFYKIIKDGAGYTVFETFTGNAVYKII